MKKKLELYKKAKEAYYIGEPIMTDDEFDALEAELQSGSTLDEYVGYKELKEKVKHPSKMLSLDKIKENDSSIPQEKLDGWLKSFRTDEWFEITPKFDGCSVNLIYIDGK